MLEKLTQSVEIIQALGDNPNIDDGLSSEELKMKFDEAARIIKAYLNESLVPYVNQLSESMAKQLDATLTRPDLAAQAQAVGLALQGLLPLNGTRSMTGNLPMGGNKVTGLATPTENADAVNKAYADQKYSQDNKPTPADIGAAPSSHVTDKNNPHGVTAAQVGALPKTGGTMTGYLMSDIDNSGVASGAFVGVGKRAYIEAYTSAENNYTQRRHFIVSSSAAADLKDALLLEDIANDGSTSLHWVYGTHNKPTPAEIGAAEATTAGVGLLAYPVGSIYISHNSTSPASLFGGTWTQITDRFLLAAGNAYALGSVGGEAYHTLTVDEMPSHQHISHSIGFDMPSSTGSNASEAMRGANLSNPFGNYHTVSSAGGGAAHNNMPPYLAVYMWYRTA